MNPAPLTCKEIADALDVSPTKSTQATKHLFEKVARLLNKQPAKTWGHIALAMADLESPPMSTNELETRRRAQTGRVDRTELHPVTIAR